MTFTLAVQSLAEADIREITEWYERISPELAFDFGNQLDRVFEFLRSNPLIYERVYRKIRRAMPLVFPYGVYFVVDGDHVKVLRVLHLSRNPREWQIQ